MPEIVAFRQPEARSTVAVVIAAVIAIRVASAGAAKDFISPSVSLVISAAVGGALIWIKISISLTPSMRVSFEKAPILRISSKPVSVVGSTAVSPSFGSGAGITVMMVCPITSKVVLI